MHLISQEIQAPAVSPASDAQGGFTADQIAVKQSSNTNVLAVATFLGAASSTFLLGLMVLAGLGRSTVSRSSENVSTFCCPNEARAVLRGLNVSIDPCEDFYGYVCSTVDAGISVRLPPTIRVAIKRRRLELAAVGAGTTAVGRMLASFKKHFLARDELFQEEITDFAAAIVGTGLANRRMNASRMVRFFAELSLRYGLPGVLSFSVPKVGTTLSIERNADCFLDDDHSFVAPGLHTVNAAINASITVDELAQLEKNLPVSPRVDAPRTLSQALGISPFSALSERDWAAIVDDVIRPAYPNLTVVITRQEEILSGVLNFLADATHQPTAVAYAIVCTAVKSLEKIDNGQASLREHPKRISCTVLGICEIEDKIVMDALHSQRMDNHIRATFAKTRTNVIRRAKGHPMFDGTSKQELAGELAKLKLMLPEETIAADLAFPNTSKTFAHNLLAARSYVFDVRRAKLARKIPSAEGLSLPSIVRNGDVIYVPINLYALLDREANRTVAVDVPVLGMEMAYQMWSFLLERPWSPRTRANIDIRLECFTQRYLNGSDNRKSQDTATAALAVASAIDAAVTAQWNTIGIVDDTKVSAGRLVYITWARDRHMNIREAVLAAGEKLPITTLLRGAGFHDFGPVQPT
ncbi:hypothetical protein HPB49_004661 [Dermacentor silvarum]|uniref:Uncharacterized protein n=1 Tax=Dermacentor silvarum TaxID=543639 RepID=A0ACB8C233_DERSI|nr:hypothetical protein HPB49_004661 [Dermacentor silvarum]